MAKKLTRPSTAKGFPLKAHASGKYYRYHNGKVLYFGNWARMKNGKLVREPGDGRDEALRLFEAWKANPEPKEEQAAPDEITVGRLCNEYLAAKTARAEAGRLKATTYGEYRKVTDYIVEAFGAKAIVADLRPADFQRLLAILSIKYKKKYIDGTKEIKLVPDGHRGPVSLGSLIGGVKQVFKFGLDNFLLDRQVRFGTEFAKPSRADIKKERANSNAGKKLFTRDEVLALLEAAKKHKQLHCMILLGINCGLGNSDLADMTLANLDLKNGWIDYPRNKTGVDRRGKLWAESVAALQEVIANRPEPKDKKHSKRVFITKYGQPWVRDHEDWSRDAAGNKTLEAVSNVNAISGQFGKLLRELKINGRRGLGFYCLRHTFRTEADATKDISAVRLVMGHSDNSIDAVYREQIGDDRLEAVAEYVHNWLYGAAKADTQKATKAKRGAK